MSNRHKTNRRLDRPSAAGGIAPAAGACSRWPLLLGGLVAVATALVFLPSLRNGFVSWDDDYNFIGNPNFRGLGWTQLKWMFTTFYFGPYQPLSWLSFGLDYVLWGMNPLGYHLTNTLLHTACAAAFFALALNLLRRLAPRDRDPDAPAWLPPAAAAFAALLFSLHPLRVESVAWVTERRDVLSGLFYLLSVLCYLRGLGKPGWPRRHAPALLFFAAALLSKAIVISLPVVLLAMDFHPLKRLPLAPRRWRDPEYRAVWLEKTPYFALALAAGGFGYFAQKSVGATLPWSDYGLMPRLSQVFYGLAFYIGKTLWPASLYPLYEAPFPRVLWSWPYWGCALAVLAVTAGLAWIWTRRPAGLALWVFYAASLAPVLGLVRLGQASTADRYTYLACLGWAMLAGALLERTLRHAGPARRLALLGLAAALCAVLGRLSLRQVAVWHDSVSLWTHALEMNPKHIFAANNLGNALLEQGRLDEAIVQYRIAVRNNPAQALAYRHLAYALSQKGRTEEAISLYGQALHWDGDDVEVLNNSGLLLSAKGRYAEAEERFRKVLRLKPGAAQSHLALAGLLVHSGRAAEALDECAEALRLEPRSAAAHNLYAWTLVHGGRAAEGFAHYREALRLDPRLAEAHVNLAAALLEQGQVEESLAHYRAALAVNPDDPDAHFSLANVLARRGELEEAAAHYRETLRLLPGHRSARHNMEAVLDRLGRTR